MQTGETVHGSNPTMQIRLQLQAVVIFFLRPTYIQTGKVKVRNYLGGRKWLMDRTFGLHLFVLGLALLVINVSAMLFALGILILFTQVFFNFLPQSNLHVHQSATLLLLNAVCY
jgi:hypothetical protein